MDRLVLNHLQIENTRRCNMHCAHCMRGEAQNFDLPPEYFELLCKQLGGIGCIEFIGGGEPTQNLNSMVDVLKSLISNNISLGGMRVVSNGKIADDNIGKFADILSVYHEYITLCAKEPDKICNTVVCAFSTDKYHEAEYAINAGYALENLIGDKINITTCSSGNLPQKAGRGIALNEACIMIREASRISVVDINGNGGCCYLRDGQKRACPPELGTHLVECGLYLTARGDLILCENAVSYHDIDDPQNRICHISNDTNVLHAIESWNAGKMPCASLKYKVSQHIDTDYLIYVMEHQKEVEDAYFEAASEGYDARIAEDNDIRDMDERELACFCSKYVPIVEAENKTMKQRKGAQAV